MRKTLALLALVGVAGLSACGGGDNTNNANMGNANVSNANVANANVSNANVTVSNANVTVTNNVTLPAVAPAVQCPPGT